MPELYLITAPEQAVQAGRWGLPLAYLAYGMGTQTLELTVGVLSLTARGGWMVLTDRTLPPDGSAADFAAQVRQECRRRRYRAVLADFERPPDGRSLEILSALAAAGQPLIVPAAYGGALPGAAVLVDSAISGGQLEDYLQEEMDRWGGRVCLALHRLRMRFPLPCPTGEGTPIDDDALQAALARRQSYFSPELGCRYCTCQEGGQFSFLLYDDAASLRHKLRIAETLGIPFAAGLYPELEDALPLLAVQSTDMVNLHDGFRDSFGAGRAN